MIFDSFLPRILDANANRAREGLRTAEDYVRFIVGDVNHAERLRKLRQGITQILGQIPGLDEAMVHARNVTFDPLQPENWKDVLRRVEIESPVAVSQRGLKRTQEALRVLEEYLRGEFPTEAERLAKLRYGAYEAEQWLLCTSPAMQVLLGSHVYVLVTSALCKKRDVIETSRAVLKGGVKVLQLREKNMPDTEYLALSRKLNALCRDYGAVFVCNDRVDLALLSEAQGAHLGQTDVPSGEARKLAGRRLLIGRSTHSAAQARAAVEIDKADYIGIGAMFETTSKAAPQIGGLKLAEEVAALKLDVPVYAIGGITLECLEDLKKAGVTRIALSQAVLGSTNPEEEARKFVEVMNA